MVRLFWSSAHWVLFGYTRRFIISTPSSLLRKKQVPYSFLYPLPIILPSSPEERTPDFTSAAG